MVIPRAKISITYAQIFKFIFRLFLPSLNRGEKIIREFEQNFAQNYGLPPAVAFNKARMAFYFLLKNLNLKPGGEVLISALHVADFINIIYAAGFKPVVVDIDPKNYCLDFDDLEKKLNQNSVLMFITHLSGLAMDMDKLLEISKRRGVPFIEDCSQAVCSYYHGKKLGTFGLATIFSLSLLKPVCTFFGGVVMSSDRELMAKIREEQKKLTAVSKLPLMIEAVKHLVFKLVTEKIIFSLIVFPLLKLFSKPFDFFSSYQRHNKTVVFQEKLPKSYFTKFIWQQALLGLNQLKTLSAREDKKIANAEFLYSRLIGNAKIKKPAILENCRNAFWTFPLYVGDIKDFKKYLAKRGIDSTAYLLAVLGDEPAFASFGFTNPQATDIKAHTLLMPMYYQLTPKELDYMASVINGY